MLLSLTAIIGPLSLSRDWACERSDEIRITLGFTFSCFREHHSRFLDLPLEQSPGPEVLVGLRDTDEVVHCVHVCSK